MMSVTNQKRKETKDSQRIDQNKIRSVIVDVLWTINNSSERTRSFFSSSFNNLQKKVKKTRQLGKTTNVHLVIESIVYVV
jgi:hypothetical protein